MNLLLTTISSTIAQAAPTMQGGDETPWVAFAIAAFGMALALLVLEAFIPSGGVLGVLSGFAAIAGIVMFFQFDTMWGMVAMAVTLLALPFVIAGMLWVWPNTPIGRALTLEENQALVNVPGVLTGADQTDAVAVGMEGEALTELRPVGVCRINSQRLDCLSQAGVIEKGTKIKVVRVEGSTVRVKAV